MPMRAVRILLLLTLASAGLLFVTALGLFFWYRQASQPAHEGVFAVHGLTAPVTVTRDAEGVPHIAARSEADALFALGYTHAQDRLWQMDFNRRIGQGRLAEVLGAAALDTDRFMRTLGVARTAEAITAKLDAETRAMLDAYAAGVNAYLRSRTGPLPPEFLLTRAEAPAPWRAQDSIGWSLLMALDLSHAWRNELSRLRLSTVLTRDEIDDFRPPYPGTAPLAVADYVALYRTMGLLSGKPQTTASIVSQAEALAALNVAHPFGDGEAIGSNNWVLAGPRSESGKPIVANDPHLGLTTPSIWYFARLSAPGLEVFGATFPGTPYVILGRNAHVAWGGTNTGPDVQDFYIERVRPDNPDEYQTPDGYAKFDVRDEIIRVKGEADVKLLVRSTRHGPVLSDVLKDARERLAAPYVLALRWTALEPEDHTLRAIRKINRAKSVAEFVEAARDWTVVQQSLVFADDAGRIGMIAPARIPLRRADNDLKGLVPMPGWDAKYDWTGWLAFDDLPRVIDPPSGRIVTANHKIVDAKYPHYLTSEWFLPYRAQRIEQLLDAAPKHSVDSMRAIQADLTSLAARDFLAALRALEPKPESAASALALERLWAWDGSMRLDAPEPLLFHAWLRALRERIFADELGALAKDFVLESELTLATLRVLRGEAASRNWCDRVGSTHKVETCAELAGEALDAAVTQLTRDSGRDVLGLRWGDMRRAVLEHRPLSNVSVLRGLFELSVPFPGDSFTVNVGQLSLRSAAPFNTRHAASFRAVFDLAAPQAGGWITTTGQSGHPFADHYGDLLQPWQRVQMLPIRWEVPKGDPGPSATLLLKPAPVQAAQPIR
jgi:penicillin amidase